MKLQKMIKDINEPGIMDLTIENFFEQKETMEKSKLFALLNPMPKGAIHHIHTTAAIPIDAYVELTKEDCVYFN